MISNYLSTASLVTNAGILKLLQSSGVGTQSEIEKKADQVFGKGLFEVSIGSTEAYGDLGRLEEDHPELRSHEGLKKLESAEGYAGVVNALADNPEILEKYQDLLAVRRREAPQESEGSAVYAALGTVIMENRDAFPPEEFVLRVNLRDPGKDPNKPENVGSITTVIPSLAVVTAQNMPKTMAAKEEAFFAARKLEAEAQEVDPDVTALSAMSNALKTLLVDNNKGLVLLDDAFASEAELADRYLDPEGKAEKAA